MTPALPFIVAHRRHGPAALASLVREALGPDQAPAQDRVADVLLALRRASTGRPLTF